MIVVGELINASRKVIAEAIKNQDAGAIKQVAKDQAAAGASYIDVNAGVFQAREEEYIKWLVESVREATDVPCSIDSPSPKALEAGLAVHESPALINSISLEPDRLDPVTSIVRGTPHSIIALCIDETGMPETTDDRLRRTERLVNHLSKADVPTNRIFIDPLLKAISTSHTEAIQFLDAVAAIKDRFPDVHVTCGLSNVSFGLPRRKVLNRVFAMMAIARGLDSAIMNPLDERMMSNIVTAETLAGRDEWCEKYLVAHRENKLVI
jgi:5-methyltetrahydrofolate--homocysteine methyltransferase